VSRWQSWLSVTTCCWQNSEPAFSANALNVLLESIFKQLSCACAGLHCISLLNTFRVLNNREHVRAGYNWEEMEKDGYRWWCQRLSHLSQYFSAYRVDHILAFFRIFQIPEKHVTGALGYFRPSRGIARAGLEKMGLWDIDRLCDPFMTVQMVKDELGEDADEVIGKYMVHHGAGKLAFKPKYNSERAIEEIPTPANSPDWLQQVGACHCGISSAAHRCSAVDRALLVRSVVP
jgi:hypothetical protein